MSAPRTQPLDRQIGAKIRYRRLEIGMTQQQVAAMLGVTYQQLHKYEVGINRIAAARLLGLSRIFGVDPNYFFEGLETAIQLAPAASKQKHLISLTRRYLEAPPGIQKAIETVVLKLTSDDEEDVSKISA